jgi:CubicO group peptidase (beta-lactamase class C family)
MLCKERSLGVALLVAALACAGAASAQDKARAIDGLLAGYRDAGEFNGAVLVAENGTIIFKQGYGLADFEWKIPNTADTKFRLGSITKQFTATLVMQLVEEGKLSLDTSLASALPYYRKDTGGRITIPHLLNHTSGIPSYTSLPNFGRDISRDPYGVREFVEKFCSGDLEFDPGTKFRYNNSGYFILGAIIEESTGKPYEQVLRERILEPLGMHASGFDHSAPVLEKRARGYERRLAGLRNADYLDMSLPYAAGSLYSTVEDLYLWDQALYGDKVLPARAKERMFTPGLENYGYGWGIRKQPIGPGKAERLTISHGGGINGFNTLIARVPEDRHLVVLLNNTGGTNLAAMSAGILEILYGRTPPPPKRAVSTVLYETARKSGIAAAIAQYREIKKSRAADFDLAEPQLNRLGYELLAEKRAADAVEVFKLNVEAFPASGNTYDSLAEAYMEAGDTELAIKTYAKALELAPSNRNAVEKLTELMKRKP